VLLLFEEDPLAVVVLVLLVFPLAVVVFVLLLFPEVVFVLVLFVFPLVVLVFPGVYVYPGTMQPPRKHKPWVEHQLSQFVRPQKTAWSEGQFTGIPAIVTLVAPTAQVPVVVPIVISIPALVQALL
jgi:hypothetical protein